MASGFETYAVHLCISMSILVPKKAGNTVIVEMPYGSPQPDDCCHTSVASVSGSLSELYVHSPSTSPFSPSPLPTFDLPAVHSNMATMDVGRHSRLPALSSSRSHNADPNLYPATRRPSVSHLEASSLNTTPTSINVSCPNLRAPDLALIPPSHSPADSKKSVRFSLEPSTVHITGNVLDKSEPAPKKPRQLLKTVVKVGVCVLFLAILLAVFAIESQNIANRHRKEAAHDTDEQPDDSDDNDDDTATKQRNSNRMQRYMTTKLPYYSVEVNLARKR